MEPNTILITGAAGGIGKETALLFARKGWFVGLCDIDEAGLASLARQIGPDQCIAHRLDVCDITSVRDAFDLFAQKTGGRFNVLFNNAGILHAGAIDAIGLEAQKKLFDVNIWGVLNCAIQALPYLKASRPAVIVNMSSASALYGHPSLTAYAASKMAVKSITEGLDLGLARHGIKVTDLMPIWVQTNLARNAADSWEGLRMKDVRIAPEDVAQKVWRAVHGSRLHWLMGWDTHLYHILGKLLPARMARLAARIIVKS